MSQKIMLFSPFLGGFKFLDPQKCMKEDEIGHSSFIKNVPRQQLENHIYIYIFLIFSSAKPQNPTTAITAAKYVSFWVKMAKYLPLPAACQI